MAMDGPFDIGQYFADLNDPRIEKKSEHKLDEIVIIAILAVICGAEHWTTIEEFGKAKLKWLKTFLDLHGGIPSHDTFGRVFAMLDADEFSHCFINWIKSLATISSGEIVAVDGKTIRGLFDRALGKSAIHMVSAWATTSGIVLAERQVDEKSNEITAIPEVLKALDLANTIVTIDAMGCQKEIAKQIVDQSANYVLALKGNQKTMHEEVKLAYDGAESSTLVDKAEDTLTTIEKDHGRIDTRNYWVFDDLSRLPALQQWPSIAAIGIAERITEKEDKTEVDRRYFIISKSMTAKEFAVSVRSHWGIENGLHWMLDVCFHEDQSRIRNGKAAQNFSTLRKISLSLLKNAKKYSKVGISGMRLRAGWDNDFLIKVLTVGL
jgi:predicted transposase YbfD/YdcC